jgi:glycosyltransferase involved in cell wall biosynthesis
VADASSGDAFLWALARRRSGPLLVARSHGLEHLVHLERLERARAGAIELSWKYPLFHGGSRLRMVAASFRRADVSLFLNGEEREFAVERLGVPADRAHVVRNGIPDELLGLELPPDPRPGDPMPIVQIGLYSKGKGVDYGSAALARVLDRHPEVSARFLGTRHGAEHVRADFPASVRHRVEVVPSYRRSELPTLLSDAHIQLFPTVFDGFGKALVEGMACGLAPVTTKVAGPADIVEHEVSGLLVPRRDPAALEAALERLLAEPELLARVRRGAHRRAQEFGWTAVAAERLAVYEAALAARD